MHSSEQILSTSDRTLRAHGHAVAYRRVGLTYPAVIDSSVERRVQDPSLLSARRDPAYADFSLPPVS